MCEKWISSRDLQPLTRCLFKSQVLKFLRQLHISRHYHQLNASRRKYSHEKRTACPPDTVSSVSTTQSGITSRASLNLRLNIILPDLDSNWKSPNIRCAGRKLNRSMVVCLFANYRVNSARSKANEEAPPSFSKSTPVQQILACSSANKTPLDNTCFS